MARLDCHAKISARSPTEVHIHLLNFNLKGTLSRLCQLLFEKGEILGGGGGELIIGQIAQIQKKLAIRLADQSSFEPEESRAQQNNKYNDSYSANFIKL